MVRKLLSIVGWETRGMHEAAYLVAALAFVSQLLALVRDRLLASTFGAGGVLDIYYAAFRIPDFLFATVASLLSLYALLPVISRLEEERPGLMLSFLRQTLLLFFVGMGIVSAVAFALAPEILSVLVPGIAHDPLQHDKLLLLTRILLLQPIFLGLSNIFANLTQLRNRFFLYSISPLLYNLGIIAGVVVLYPIMGIAGLGWGVVIGAILHMLVQVPYFFEERAPETMSMRRTARYVMEVLKLSLPRTLALAATQVSLLGLTAIASLLSTGSITIFMFAYNLQMVPLTIIGFSYSVAAFPTLARLHARGETSEFVRHVETAVRHIIFWSIPVTVFVIILRAQLVRTILGSGAFDWSATRLTAAALALFILSLAAQSLTYLIARAYYAAGNTRKPLYYGLADIAVSLGSALALAALFHESSFARSFIESTLRVSDIGKTTVLMLALGYSLGSIVEFAIGFYFFARDFSIPLIGVRRLTVQSFVASVFGAALSYGMLALTGSLIDIDKVLAVFAQGFLAGILGIAVTGGILLLMRNRELLETIDALLRKFKDRGAVALEPTDIAS